MLLQPVKNFEEAQRLMFEDVPKTQRNLFMKAGSLERSKAFFELAGEPQNKLHAIHISGTSGKGSTAHLVEGLLRAHGKSTCLHVSPHVYDVRERLSINNALISEEKFCQYINELIPAIEDMSQTDYGRPTFYEVSTMLGFMAGVDNKVDYTVLETGLGGLYDSSNSIERKDKLAVVGRIGLDHVPILANPAELEGTEANGLLPPGTEALPTEIERIAVQKAGIMAFGGAAVALRQDPAIDAVIQSIADFRKTKLQWVNPSDVVEFESIEGATTFITLRSGDTTWKHIKFNLAGTHQLENLALAFTAVQAIAQRDGWQLTEVATRQALKEVWLPGRFEVRTVKGKTVVLDGSHNPQKVQALVETFQRAYPNQQATVVLAMNKSKDASTVIAQLAPIANEVICTDFFTDKQDFLQKAFKPSYLAELAKQATQAQVEAANNQGEALAKALRTTNQLILVTGSFYFLGEINDILKTYES